MSSFKKTFDTWWEHIRSLGPIFSKLTPALEKKTEKDRIFVFEELEKGKFFFEKIFIFKNRISKIFGI